MVQTIRNRYTTDEVPSTPAVPTQAPLVAQEAPAARDLDVDAFADNILSQTEERLPDDLTKFIDDAASYEETQRDKMQRFARSDLRSREGQVLGSPYMRSAAMRIGATGGSLLARLTGNEEAANAAQRLGSAYATEHKRLLEDQTFPGVDAVARETLNVGSEMTTQAPFIALAAMTGSPAGLGTPAVITQQAITTADAAYTDAIDAGKDQRSAGQHAIGMGVIEGAVTGLMSSIGLGGFEKVFGSGASRAAQTGVRAGLRKFGIETMSELTEEFIVQAGQSFLGWVDGVDPDAMTPERWKQAAKDITLQTIATMGVYSAPAHLAGMGPKRNSRLESLRDRIVATSETAAANDRGVSRQQWSELGMSTATGKTEAERTEIVNHMAEVIQANREAAASEAPTQPVETASGMSALDQAMNLAPPEAAAGATEQAVSPEQAPAAVAPEPIATPMGDTVAPDAGTQEQAAFEQLAPNEGPDLVSTAQRLVAQVREGYSLPGLEKSAPQTQVQWLEEAGQRIEQNPHWIRSVMNDVVSSKRAPTPVENAGLTIRMRELKNDIDERIRLLDDVEAPDDGKAAAQVEAELLLSDLDEVMRISDMGRSAAGRALVAGKLTLDQDYTPGTLLARERVLRKRPLTQGEIQEVSALAKEIKDLQSELAKERAKAQERTDNEGLDSAIAQARKPRRQSARKKAASARRKASVEQFKSAFNNLESFKPSVKGFLKGESGAMSVPVELIQAAAELVKAHVNEGYVTFSEFWGDVHSEVGDFNDSKEVFRQAWERVRENGGIEQLAIKPDQYKEIAQYANRMLDAIVRGGETDRNAVLSEVHDELLRVVPGIDRRSTLDAITRQGNYASESRAKTEAQKNVADIRRQLKMVRRLKQITSGKLPKGEAKTPAQISEEVKALKQQIKEAEAKSPVLLHRKQRDVETRLRNRLLDVIDRKRKAKKPTPELEAEEKRLRSEIAAAQKIGKLEDKLGAIRRGEVPGVKAKTEKGEDSPEVTRLKEQITKAKADSPAVQKALAKAREESYAKSLENRLAEYERQLQEGDVAPKKRGKAPESKKIGDLQFQIEVAKGKVKARREKLQIENMNKWERSWHRLKKVLHTQRTIQLSLDSPLLRQGSFFAYSHPKRAAQATLNHFKAWGSEKGYFDLMQSIADDPYYKTYREMGVDFTEMNASFTRGEEDYAEGYLKELSKIAGVKYPIQAVRASGRGHSALMNLIRSEHAKALIETFGGPDNMTDAQKKILGRFVNITTGRGALGSLEKHAEAAALVFLAPRYVVSRFQQAIMVPAESTVGLFGENRQAHALVLREYARAFAGNTLFQAMLTAALYFMSPEEERKLPELDLRSSAFIKPGAGNTLLDLSGGISQVCVLITRVVKGEYKNRKGEVKPLRGPDVKRGDYSMEDYLRSYERYKFAPWLSFAYDLATLKTGGGFEDATAGNLAKNYLVPIPINDVIKSTTDLGIPRAIVVNAVMEAGSGMQTYDVKADQKGVVPNPFATE